MFGYVKKDEVLEILRMEARITDRQMGIYSKLATTADNDEDKANYWNLSEEFRIRHDEVLNIISKLRRTI